ncbi:FeoC-like transcriptional regulator [Acidithiobacillus sp. M4-SHS-6]|uniref:FeoC-like transcriptional regulator n=1 Tax=Acidithiobacillus sp. M4-SHS-6 TaxID=3383024 RepID=UPI0039BECBAC
MTTLFAVRDLLRKQALLTSSQIAATLNLSTDIVDDMLRYWQRRGHAEVVPLHVSESCGSTCASETCTGCKHASQRPDMLVWRWREPSATETVVTFHPRYRS